MPFLICDLGPELDGQDLPAKTRLRLVDEQAVNLHALGYRQLELADHALF
jgi:hypothetical protein